VAAGWHRQEARPALAPELARPLEEPPQREALRAPERARLVQAERARVRAVQAQVARELVALALVVLALVVLALVVLALVVLALVAPEGPVAAPVAARLLPCPLARGHRRR